MNWAEQAGGMAAVFAVVVTLWAVVPYISNGRALRRRSIEIEGLLARKTAPNDNSLLVSQIANHMNLTEAQVSEAAYENKRIEAWSGQLGNERRLRIFRKPD